MVRIRRATDADRPRVRAIQSTALDEPWPELLDGLGAEQPAVYVLDARSESGGGVVAYAVVIGNDGTLTDPPVAYLPEFAVSPARQGEGHGTRLMEGLFDRLAERGLDAVRLTVRVDDDRARSFYEGLGFERVERVPDQYENADGLVLRRGLAGRGSS